MPVVLLYFGMAWICSMVGRVAQ